MSGPKVFYLCPICQQRRNERAPSGSFFMKIAEYEITDSLILQSL